MLNSSKELVADGLRLPQQFEALVFPLMDRLFSTALRMTRDQHDAEDLVQDTYLKAYRFFHRFQLGTNFRAWMFRILTNNFINEYRNKKKEPARVNFERLLLPWIGFPTNIALSYCCAMLAILSTRKFLKCLVVRLAL